MVRSIIPSSYGVNAPILVDLLLELNIVNVKDVDAIINRMASSVLDPRAEKWFRRVPRFFLINIDRLQKEPYLAKAEPRTPSGSKYYYSPQGGWVAGKGRSPERNPNDPLPVREEYDPEKQTYTSALHEPAVQRDLEQSFTPFKPAKAKVKRLLGEPPTKKELQPWMTDPQAKAKEFHHFDPVQTGRRELFTRLTNLIHYLNYNARFVGKKFEDEQDQAATVDAEKLMRRLETMKTDDVNGFRDVLKDSADFHAHVKEKPWFFTKDGLTIAEHGALTMRKVILPETASAFSKRTTAEGDVAAWCTKSVGTAGGYVKQGPLYFIDKDELPYILAHFESGQVRQATTDSTITDEQVREIAPLFLDKNRFPIITISHGDARLGREVTRLRQSVR